jgi:hypothetical protein
MNESFQHKKRIRKEEKKKVSLDKNSYEQLSTCIWSVFEEPTEHSKTLKQLNPN